MVRPRNPRPNSPPAPEFLAFQNVALRVGDSLALANLNWTWRQGQQWAILGPDGSGKSLLVRALLDEAPVARGEIRGPCAARGWPETALHPLVALVSPERQRQLALAESTFYQSRWHSGLEEGQRTVADFLSQASVEEHNPYEVAPARSEPGAFRTARREYIRWLGIRPLWRRRVAHLSNGEMRKTLLVFTLLRSPRLLILEDPFAGLDVATRRTLRNVIRRLMRAGWRVLVVTHRVAEIPSSATHLLIFDERGILAQGPKKAMLALWRRRFASPPNPRRAAGHRVPGRPSAKPGAPLVELERVTITGAGKRILHNVSWTIRQGERWALQGPNGAGKTTLLNLIQGDHPQAYSQQIRLFGRSTDSTQTLWQARQRLGWMSPELHQHYPAATSVLDTVVSGFFNSLGLYEAASRRQRATAMQWLRDLGLAHRAAEPFGELSFGQQRLALLARAAVKRPRLLILDEPAQGLDAMQRLRLLAAVDRVVAETNSSLVFVTHHPRELPHCITHLLCLRGGRVQFAGPRRTR